VFGVPLRGGGFGVGVVARRQPSSGGIVFGYFFGPRRDSVPQLDEVPNLDPAAAVLARMFGDLGLINGAWPVIGALPGWDRKNWPMPLFTRYEELSGRRFVVCYADDDPAVVVSEAVATPDETIALPKDGLAGAGFVEGLLSDLLG
jgi:hypothetical protein